MATLASSLGSIDITPEPNRIFGKGSASIKFRITEGGVEVPINDLTVEVLVQEISRGTYALGAGVSELADAKGRYYRVDHVCDPGVNVVRISSTDPAGLRGSFHFTARDPD